EIIVLDQISMAAPKTKEMAEVIHRIAGQASVLIILPGENANVEMSARNLTKVKTLRANYLNIRDVLGYERLVMPLDVLDVIQSYLGS
ncbi:MAG: 50S ribosomal protein L4, partial [Anaerolineales bacterium]|nr:50S ribosomal protein L4 [Anaerolineales bacterium]